MKPVAVIIPTYNAGPYLRDAIFSVIIQPEVGEVIVVDDGSTDDSVPFALQAIPGLRVVTIAHGGQGAAIKAGVLASSAPLLGFLDADDLACFDRFMFQTSAIMRGARAVTGHAQEFRTLPGFMKPRRAMLFSALTIEREAFLEVGFPDPSLRMGMTLEWFSRAIEKGIAPEVLPETVYFRRLHDKNYGIVHKDERGEYHAALKLILDRKRAAQVP